MDWKAYMRQQAGGSSASTATAPADMWPWEVEAAEKQRQLESKEREYTADEWAVYETGWYWHKKKRKWLNKYDEIEKADQVVKYVAKNKKGKKGDAK